MRSILENEISVLPWDADRYRGTRSDTLGLYIHLPYCRTKCTYCAFVSAPPQTEEEMDAYTDAVIVHLQAGAKEANGRKVHSVFFGGGTPSLLGASRLVRILQCIHNEYNLYKKAEITLEANPESATLELFEQLVPLGVNRISMGAQSFNEAELSGIGRVHTVEDIPHAVNNAKQAGINNVSLDLIYGLPRQSLEVWQHSLKRALACGLSHLSAYALSYEEGTLLHRQMREGTITIVDEDTYVAMYESLHETMQQKGFKHYEISNWCKPGLECRHNLIYWNRDEYLAFGVSAHGMVNGWRYSIHPSPKEYLNFFQSDEYQHQEFLQMDIVKEKEEIAAKMSAEDVMIFGLRKTEGVNCSVFQERFGYTPMERWETEILSYINLGWLEHNGDYLRLTNRAYLISNEVMQGFIT